MTIKYLDDDGSISYYNSARSEYTTTQASSSVSQSVSTQTVTQSVFNNYTWVAATSSNYSQWTIVSGTSEIAQKNQNNSGNTMSYSKIGSRVSIRGDEIFTNSYREASSEKNNGIAIYRSASVGWYLNDYINIPTSSTTQPNSIGLAREFSVDGNYLIVPGADALNNTNPKLHIYKSSSSGWASDSILTTSSYNDYSSVDDTNGVHAYRTAVIKGDTIFANGFYGGSGDRYVAFFRSSSVGGWKFEDSVQTKNSSTIGGTGDSNASVGISGVAIDFDGSTAVVGSKQADGNQNYHEPTGRVHIFSSNSSGWTQEARLGLSDLGLTSDVQATFGSTYGVSEYRTWTRFGYKSCVISGSYIAAAAQGEELYNGTNWVRQKHSVFILKSSSAGWLVDARINDPAENLNLGPGSQNSTTDTEFGTGLFLRDNALVVNSGAWQSDWSSNRKEGRSYVYVSSSSGWS